MDDRTEYLTPDLNSSKQQIKKLHDLCNWDQLDNIAIEYHGWQNTIYLHYRELLGTKNLISDFLRCIEAGEFIGINFDIPEYCTISVILGILSSGYSFVHIPPVTREFMNLKNHLNICYIFCKDTNIEGDIVYEFTIHNKRISLMKLKKNTQKQIKQSTKQNYSYAYAISTSGTTGIPKVVKVFHSCIVPNVLDLSKILTVTKHDKIAQFTSFTFDPSIVEIFLALSNAATLFMVSRVLKNNSNRLLKEAHSSQVTILQVTPSIFTLNWAAECLKNSILSRNTSVKAILFGGEPFPKAELLLELVQNSRIKIYNIYGITEVSCWASINEIKVTDGQFDAHCLGQALSDTVFQIRNERGEIMTNGTGTLYIGSNKRICVINDEDLEELKLPLFRDTGDIVSIDERGMIFYRGRRNSTIKRFGNKVDLTKLEEFILQIDFVKSSHAVWDDNNHYLHLCFSTKDSVTNYHSINHDVMKHLHKLDPLYRPDKIHYLEQIEFTTSGKISLEFLKQHYIKGEATNGILENIGIKKIEATFRSIWRNNLQSLNEGFVKLGGTSVMALQISNAFSEATNLQFPELIGMLLMDATVDECLSYIKSVILSSNREKLQSDLNGIKKVPLAATIAIEAKESSENFKMDSKNPKDCGSTVLTNEIYMCQWYKCRGQTYKHSSNLLKETKLQYDEISKVKILETYDLKKCVDASVTVFNYSDGKTYATVGSHSGLICTFELGKERRNSTFKIKLPDRIEASILVLDNFQGIIGCYDGYIYCVDLKTGRIVWKHQTGDVVKCSAILYKEKELIFVGSYDCHIYCLSVKDGSEVWKIKSGTGSVSASGCLHISSNTVLFGTLDGTCLALQQCSGEVVWRHKLSDPIFIAPLSLNNGLVLFCTVTGLLCCFDIEVNVKLWTYKINGNIFSYITKQSDPSSKYENIVLASRNKNVYCLQSEGTNFKTEPTLKYVLNFHSPISATPWCENNFLLVACTDGTLSIYNFMKNRLIKIEKLPGEVFSSPVVHSDVVIVGCRDNNVYILELV